MDFGAFPAAPGGPPAQPTPQPFAAEVVDAPGEALPSFSADDAIDALGELPAPPPAFEAAPPPPAFEPAPEVSAASSDDFALDLAGLEELPAPPPAFEVDAPVVDDVLDDLPAPPPAFEVPAALATATTAPSAAPAPGQTLSSRVGALAEALENENRYADAALLYEVQAALAALGR
jgi:hypothetical protein